MQTKIILLLSSQFCCFKIYFSCLIALVRTSSAVWNRSGESSCPFAVPHFQGDFSLSRRVCWMLWSFLWARAENWRVLLKTVSSVLDSRLLWSSQQYFRYIECFLSLFLVILFFGQYKTSVLHFGEGNGTPLQYSCLENPKDGGAWWAAVHGVAELDTTERLHFHFSLSCMGEGNGNPLQCSCLENPRDGGAWWAAVYGVAQSRTRLK